MRPVDAVVVCTREISKSLGSESPGFKRQLSRKAGGWIRAILAKSCARNENNASPKLFFFVPSAGERPREWPCTAQKKRKKTLGLGSRGEDAMDVAQLKMSSSSVSAVSRPKTIRGVYGEWSLLPS